MSLWRVTYKERIIMDTDTFSSFEDAWSYTRNFPDSITYIPYNTWFYIAKKEAKKLLEESNRLIVAWSPSTAEITITRS
jgi:hypothetical protein